jgi:hypothetical protein
VTCATVVTAKPCKGPSLRLFFEGFTAQCIAEQLAACANTPPMPQDIVTHDWAQIGPDGRRLGVLAAAR